MQTGHQAGSQIGTHTGEMPLYVDLDGTLVRTDVAQELLVRSFRNPEALLRGVKSLSGGVSALKHALAQTVPLRADLLPYRPEVLDHIKAARAAGRRVVLATAADQAVAEAVAVHLDLFDGILASREGHNLKGKAKLAAIEADAKGAPFEYLGDSKADLPIWEQAAQRGFAQTPKEAASLATQTDKTSLHLAADGGKPSALLKAMRPHQWAKNALVFLPLFFAHLYLQPGAFFLTVLAFISFSLSASAVYLVNDLLDIEADRAHATKHKRPFAAGRLRPLDGVLAAMVLFTVSLGLGFLALGPVFGAVLVLYILMTNAYSFWLKAISTVDVVVLALLYTVRIAAGAAALLVVPSPWLLTFSLFFFLSLAYMKRFIELAKLEDDRQLPARGYWGDDLSVVRTFGISNAALSLLTLAEYVSAPEVQARYGTPLLLWCVIPFMMYWSYRSWLKATRGQVGDDPVVYALTDRISQITALIIIAIIVLAHQLHLGWSTL